MPKKRPGGMLSTTAANIAATVAAIYKALPRQTSTATGGKRKGRTGTKVVPKPKTGSRLAQRVIGGSGNKSTYVENHKLKGSKRVLASLTPTNFYQYNNAWRISSNPGLQTANSALYFHQPDLLQQITQFGASANNSKQMLIKSLFADYTLVNTTSAPIYLTIYDVGFKREMDTSDTTTWSPELAWNNGEIQEGNAIGASMVGSDPKKISLFKEYYAVKKKSNHFLAPGEVHKHTVLVRPNKFITKNRILDSIRYAGLTYATMFVAKGTLVDTSGNTTFDVSGVPAYSVHSKVIMIPQVIPSHHH